MNLMSLQDSCTGMEYNSIHVPLTVTTDKDIVTITVYFPGNPEKEFRILDYYTDNRLSSGITDSNGCGTVYLKFVPGIHTIYARICDIWIPGNSCLLTDTDTTNQIELTVVPSPVSTDWLLVGGVAALGGYYLTSSKRRRRR